MAVLKKIVVQDFRNIELAELDFSANINCISGGNGEGKTNLIDAVWYLSMTKSAFRLSDKDNFRRGTKSFSLAGTYLMHNGMLAKFTIRTTSDKEKILRKDDKPYSRISDHIGELPVVIVSPCDISLVTDSADERRRFLNMVLSQLDKEYLSDVVQYNRLLGQRNAVLKQRDGASQFLDVLDERMSVYADKIYSRRKTFIGELSPQVGKFYNLISGGKEAVSVIYRSDIEGKPLQESLSESRERDMALGFTTAGVHRDDLTFGMDSGTIRRFGSQGQQKSFLVALKFAQYELMKEKSGVPPILLLDDVFDKLDMDRTSNLLSMVAGNDFGQIFITDSNKVRLSGIVDNITADRAYFEACGGTFKREEV